MWEYPCITFCKYKGYVYIYIIQVKCTVHVCIWLSSFLWSPPMLFSPQLVKRLWAPSNLLIFGSPKGIEGFAQRSTEDSFVHVSFSLPEAILFSQWPKRPWRPWRRESHPRDLPGPTKSLDHPLATRKTRGASCRLTPHLLSTWASF